MTHQIVQRQVCIEIAANADCIEKGNDFDLIPIETSVDTGGGQLRLLVPDGDTAVPVADGSRLDVYVDISGRARSQRPLRLRLLFPMFDGKGPDAAITVQRVGESGLQTLDAVEGTKTKPKANYWYAEPDPSDNPISSEGACEWFVLTRHRPYSSANSPQTQSICFLCGIHTKPPR